MADNPNAANNAANAELAKNQKAAADARAKQLADSRKETEARTKEQLERAESTQPTPTQEENDRAKLGISSLADLDDKEDDGSPVDDGSMDRSLTYSTRDTKPKK